MRPQFFVPDDVIYRENEVPLEMFFIVAGIVELYVTRNGIDRTQRRLSDGEHFGAKHFLHVSNSIRDSNARTETYAWLMCLSKKSLGEIVSTNLLFSDEISELLMSEHDDEEKKEEQKDETNSVILKLSKSHRKILVREKLRRRALAMDAVQAFLNAANKGKEKGGMK